MAANRESIIQPHSFTPSINTCDVSAFFCFFQHGVKPPVSVVNGYIRSQCGLCPPFFGLKAFRRYKLEFWSLIRFESSTAVAAVAGAAPVFVMGLTGNQEGAVKQLLTINTINIFSLKNNYKNGVKKWFNNDSI